MMQRDTFAVLWRLAIRHPESSVKMIPMEEIFDDERTDDDLWYKDYMPNFQFLPKDRLPSGAKGGITYTTIVLDPGIFLPWLKRNLESSGVDFKRMTLHSLSDAYHLGHDILINATGAGPIYLDDIQDDNMELLKGQIMIIKSDYKKCFMRDDGKNYTYVIPRLDGKIVRRIHRSLPERFSIDLSDYDIVGHNVCIRPYRSSGMRIENEVKDGQKIVHAYGTSCIVRTPLIGTIEG
ncbi:unnamed protein product [Penicillium salamii]|uniref:FAD dependent oxidoreductase domain-containing protein n=1 Tax=Penicillium salamii TaxID=1612424 RepID=A0A9W4JXK2_9EURO|nr:unnamed protein product [Penicillium salamii]CAG8379035.1 unnamed protein product [Penicillium salamii]CAG8420214.1 unnamed protein product [Penicillium salamii]CAG8423611.1 unnamed protein product [Penicillium salamii]